MEGPRAIEGPVDGHGQVTRRRLLGLAAVGGAAAVAAVRGWSPGSAATRAPAGGQVASAVGTGGLWSAPSSWSDGIVPGPGAVVQVSGDIVLDTDASVAGVEVASGGRLTFAPGRSVRLASAGNVLVRGDLVMAPTSAAVEHVLDFPAIDESRAVGGGMGLVETDVGVWVLDGRLALTGTPRTEWVRAAVALGRGATTIELRAAPVGWNVGDELVVTPTGTPADSAQELRFDPVVVASVSGTTVTLRAPLQFDHPVQNVGRGAVLTAEVLNLTRNVRIEGRPQGRFHTWIGSGRAQTLTHVGLRHFGPRRSEGRYTRAVKGRYGLHWHMNGNGSAGSVARGVVAREGGSHAFVAHASNGISFVSCISYDTLETAYWWDLAADTRAEPPRTDRVLYDRCVAAKVGSDPPFRGYTLSGFFLGAGAGNVARGCVAVGVQGSKSASGFIWPENAAGIWTFTGCVAHNNRRTGIFVWQNDPQPHVVRDFISSCNGVAGIVHGAYGNVFQYLNVVLYANGSTGLVLHALASRKGARFDGLLVDGAGLGRYAVQTERHNVAARAPTVFSHCDFRGYQRAAFGLLDLGPVGGAGKPGLFDLVACTFSGRPFWMSAQVPRGTRVRVQDALRRTVVLTPRTTGRGRLDSRWNALVRKARPFARPTRSTVRPLSVLSSSAG